jgi:hypothetical protein
MYVPMYVYICMNVGLRSQRRYSQCDCVNSYIVSLHHSIILHIFTFYRGYIKTISYLGDVSLLQLTKDANHG